MLAVIGDAPDEGTPETILTIAALRHLAEGRTDEAMADLRDATGASPTSAPGPLAELGRLHIRARRAGRLRSNGWSGG